MVKPVTMWAALFALLDGVTGSYQDDVEGDDEAGDVATVTIMPDFATVEAKIKEAATPAKRAPLPKPISPMTLILSMIPLSSPDAVLWTVVAKNMERLQDSVKSLSNELAKTQTQLLQQTALASSLMDKLNMFSGLMGTPKPGQASPTVWHAVSEVQRQNEQLTEQISQLPTTDSDLDGLMEALEQDLRGSNKRLKALETKVWENSASLGKCLNVD